VPAEWVKLAIKWAEIVATLIRKLRLEKLRREEIFAALFGLAIMAFFISVVWALPAAQRFPAFISVLGFLLILVLVVFISRYKRR